LRISPWEIPFLLLLYFSSPWRFLFPHRRCLSLWPPTLSAPRPPPPLSPPCGWRCGHSGVRRTWRRGLGRGGTRASGRRRAGGAGAGASGGRLRLTSGGARRGRAALVRERGWRRARAEAGGWRPGARAGMREAWSRRVSGTRARRCWSGVHAGTCAGMARERGRSYGDGCGAGGCSMRAAQDVAVEGFCTSRCGHHGSNGGDVLGFTPPRPPVQTSSSAHARHEPRTHAAQAYTDGAEARQGRSKRGSGNRRRRSSYAGQRQHAGAARPEV
jgi:hypothetical protein